MIRLLTFLIFVSIFLGSCNSNEGTSPQLHKMVGMYEGICISKNTWLDLNDGTFKTSIDTMFNVSLEILSIDPKDDAPEVGMISTNTNCAWDYYEFPIEQLDADTIRGVFYGSLQYTIEIELYPNSNSIATFWGHYPSEPGNSETTGEFVKIF